MAGRGTAGRTGRGSLSRGCGCSGTGATGPEVPGPDGSPRGTLLFCAWLAWSRFRVVLPVWDRKLPTLIACLDAMLRRFGGVPAYALTDNEKTVTVEHVAGVPVRHPEIVAVGRHYGMTVHTCVPYDPESKGGSEATVRVAKADLVPARGEPAGGLRQLRRAGGARARSSAMVVNGRVHRETCAVPAQRLEIERSRLHPVPDAPHTAALGTTRVVNTDQTIRFGSVRYSTPPGLAGAEVWVRADGDELVVAADLAALPLRPAWAGTGRWAWPRSPGTACQLRGTRGSTWPTTRIIRSSRTGRRGRRGSRRPRAGRKRSWRSATAPGPG